MFLRLIRHCLQRIWRNKPHLVPIGQVSSGAECTLRNLSIGHMQGRPEAALLMRSPTNSSRRPLPGSTSAVVNFLCLHLPSPEIHFRVRNPVCLARPILSAVRACKPPWQIVPLTWEILLLLRLLSTITDPPSVKGQIPMFTAIPLARGRWLVPPLVDMVTPCSGIMFERYADML